MEIKPDFLGIGAQKAATRWLYEQLKQHPEIYLPPQKELHYFDVLKNVDNYFERFNTYNWKKNFRKLPKKDMNDYWWYIKYLFGPYSDKWYSSLFLDSLNRVSGDITPKYSVLKTSEIEKVYNFKKELRLIYFLRNPVSRAWSHFRMKVRKSGLDYDSMKDDEVFDLLSTKNVINRGLYHQIILKWYKFFPEEQLFIGFLEQVKESPNDLLKNVLHHLRVSEDTSYFQKSMMQPSNTGKKISIKPQFEEFLRDKYYKPNEDLFKLLGNPRIKKWNDS